jgi:hypothetical protein
MCGLKVDLDNEPLGSIKRSVSWPALVTIRFSREKFSTVMETPKGKVELVLRKVYVYVKADMSNHVLHLATSYKSL